MLEPELENVKLILQAANLAETLLDLGHRRVAKKNCYALFVSTAISSSIARTDSTEMPTNSTPTPTPLRQ